MCIEYQTGQSKTAMLILTRYRGQSIKIGADVTVKVLKVRDRYILLGIEAPDGVRVLRAELAERDALNPRGVRPRGTGRSSSA
jgi:carbon storage regulator